MVGQLYVQYLFQTGDIINLEDSYLALWVLNQQKKAV